MYVFTVEADYPLKCLRFAQLSYCRGASCAHDRKRKERDLAVDLTSHGYILTQGLLSTFLKCMAAELPNFCNLNKNPEELRG